MSDITIDMIDLLATQTKYPSLLCPWNLWSTLKEVLDVGRGLGLVQLLRCVIIVSRVFNILNVDVLVHPVAIQIIGY